MKTYISFFPQGFSELVPQVLQKEIGKFDQKILKANHIVYQTQENWQTIQNLDMFETTYLLTKYFESPNHTLEKEFHWAKTNLEKIVKTFSYLEKTRVFES